MLICSAHTYTTDNEHNEYHRLICMTIKPTDNENGGSVHYTPVQVVFYS